MHLVDAGWSSLVARRAHNPKVVGSNPAPATNEKDSKFNTLIRFVLFRVFLCLNFNYGEYACFKLIEFETFKMVELHHIKYSGMLHRSSNDNPSHIP